MDLLDGRVVSNFIVQALRNKPLTIYGDGKQTRSFCFVSDLIEAFILIMETDSKVTGPINLGNPREFTMIELATKVIELTNSNSALEWLPLPADDPKQRKPDITLARNTFGWEPKIDLETGLRLTISDFSSRLGKP
jgi:UDP-glucuronate decarboxylase